LTGTGCFCAVLAAIARPTVTRTRTETSISSPEDFGMPPLYAVCAILPRPARPTSTECCDENAFIGFDHGPVTALSLLMAVCAE
jgi:hypothetical protein